jgi:hypothetical protein
MAETGGVVRDELAQSKKNVVKFTLPLLLTKRLLKLPPPNRIGNPGVI